MNDKFQLWLMLIQTAVLAQNGVLKTDMVDCCASAYTVDPTCLMPTPLDMSKQAVEFVNWQCQGGHHPAWVKWRKLNGE